MRNALLIAQEIQQRLDEIESDPKWLNDGMAELTQSLEAGQQTAITFSETLAKEQVAAIDKFTLATREATAAKLKIAQATINAPLKKSAAPRDINYVAFQLFTMKNRHAHDNNITPDTSQLANDSWDAAEVFINVSKQREKAYLEALAAATT